MVIQRVTSASVVKHETGEVVGSISKGLFVLVGFRKGDSESDVATLSSKLLKLRIMSDENDKMNYSVVDAKAELLIVSQFTLYANTKDGNRPSFIESLEPDKAKILYDRLVLVLQEAGILVRTGSFGNYMDIAANLDGPVTIILET